MTEQARMRSAILEIMATSRYVPCAEEKRRKGLFLAFRLPVGPTVRQIVQDVGVPPIVEFIIGPRGRLDIRTDERWEHRPKGSRRAAVRRIAKAAD